MKKSINTQRLIALAVIMVVLFALAAVISSNSAYKSRRAKEKLTTVDMQKMHGYSEENSKAVMKALASGKEDKLAKLMINSEGAAAVVQFADWSKADFDKAVSMGSGSLVKEADKKGRMEINERFFVDADGKRYVLFVETSTSRWGRENDGVSAVGVTTFDHFDELDYMWNGEPDDHSVLAGELLWDKK